MQHPAIFFKSFIRFASKLYIQITICEYGIARMEECSVNRESSYSVSFQSQFVCIYLQNPFVKEFSSLVEQIAVVHTLVDQLPS